jgi:hypothetical protein
VRNFDILPGPAARFRSCSRWARSGRRVSPGADACPRSNREVWSGFDDASARPVLAQSRSARRAVRGRGQRLQPAIGCLGAEVIGRPVG